MRRTTIHFLVALMLCLAGGWGVVSRAQSSAGNGQPIWAGSSGGYYAQWTGNDISVRAKQTSNKSLYSARALLLKDLTADEVREAEFDLHLLSVVGPIVTFEVRAYVDGGGAHPQLVTYYQVVDAARPTHKAILTDFFPDAQVLKALLADKIIQKALARDGVQPTPKT